MIRHRPFGSGHPYSVDTEQRDPIDPVAGEPITLGVRTSPDVDAVDLELEVNGTLSTIPLARAERRSRGQVVDGGHLASAQARLARAPSGWTTTVSAPGAGRPARYRFRSERETTRWFEFTASQWQAADDVAGAIPSSTTLLTDGRTARRVRFALPLAPGEHVSGFGERFDALDHRGASLDSVVFEQYKSQGAERKTYLPMPFAHVVGGEGWGFHVRTSRRVWFDIGASEADRLWIEAETGADGAVDLGVYRGTPSRGAASLPRRGRPSAGAAGLGVPALGERQRVEHAGRGHAAGGCAPRPRHPGRGRS